MKPALYNAYITGATGSSLLLFYLGEGKACGIDAGGGSYQGTYEINIDGSIQLSIEMNVPADTPLITGTPQTDAPRRFSLSATLPIDFYVNGNISTIFTPLGPVNAFFEKRMEI